MEKIFRVVDGLKLLKLFPEENAIFGLNYKAEDEDVFVATYPKSGTTWTLQIISLIMHDGNIPNDDLDGNGMFLEAQGPVKLAQLKRPFLIGTHLPQHKLAWNSEAKYVVVARSPKDVLVSYYHHLTGQFQLTMDIHEFRKLWLDGACPYGNYFDWLNTWAPYLTEPNVKLVFYEDMKANIAESVIDLAKFLGYDLVADSPLLTTIVEKSSIDYMRVQMQGAQAGEHRVRKGKVGGWKGELSPEDASAVDQQCRELLANGPFARLCQ